MRHNVRQGATVFSEVAHDLSFASYGSARSLKRFHSDIECDCGDPLDCICELFQPPTSSALYPRKNKGYSFQTRPTLLFSMRNTFNSSMVISFFSKDVGDAIEELDRLNQQYTKERSRRMYAGDTREIGWYFDNEDPFDLKWNSAARATERQHIENQTANN